MTPRERRTFVLAAALLLAASLVRWGFGPGREAPLLPPDSAGIRDTLLAATRKAVADADRRARPLDPGERIDPNRAAAFELDRLPGVGPSLAEAIVAARKEEGGFASAEALQRVKGIGPALAARMAPHLDFSHPPPGARRSGAGAAASAGSTPPGYRLLTAPVHDPGPTPGAGSKSGGGRKAPSVELNRASAEELETLRGVGPALAGRILELRRRKGRFRRVDELLEVPGIGPATLERLKERVRLGP